MGSSKVLAFLAVLVVLVPSSASRGIFDSLAPALAPFYDDLCHKIFCGKGTCKAKDSIIFDYECECEPGWKRSDIDIINDNVKFHPCAYPDCALDFPSDLPPLPEISLPTLPPFPEKPIPFNWSNFDPCRFTNCGAGTCKNTSSYQYICECNPGNENIFNISSFPCYNKQSLGPDCAPLKLGVSHTKIKANTINHGTSFLPGKFHWMTIFVTSVAMVLWK